jgi:hypothetical protein
MKKASRISKKGTRKARRSKKLTRRVNRRRQHGGGATINCVRATGGVITATSSNPAVTVTSPNANTLVITTSEIVKNITFGNAPPSKVGSPTGINLRYDNKFIIPKSSHLYTKPLTPAQMKLDETVGMDLSKGLTLSNLNPANLGTNPNFVITLV